MIELDEKQAVVNWKMKWLISVGFSPGAAKVIAEDEAFNWRLAMACLPHAKKKGYDEVFVLDLLS